MLDSDVLFGFRLRLLDHAREVGVSAACRTFGVHRSTYYRPKHMAERSGLEMLRPRERRAPRMPNQLSPVIETRILAYSIGHPGLGPRRISADLAQARWGGILVSPSGVWRALRRHGRAGVSSEPSPITAASSTHRTSGTPCASWVPDRPSSGQDGPSYPANDGRGPGSWAMRALT